MRGSLRGRSGVPGRAGRGMGKLFPAQAEGLPAGVSFSVGASDEEMPSW